MVHLIIQVKRQECISWVYSDWCKFIVLSVVALSLFRGQFLVLLKNKLTWMSCFLMKKAIENVVKKKELLAIIWSKCQVYFWPECPSVDQRSDCFLYILVQKSLASSV